MIPNGTVVFTDQGGDLVNNVLGLKWTHVLIRLDNIWYEATFPRVRRSKSYKHTREAFLKPQVGLRMDAMLREANKQLGRVYSAAGYFHPELYGKTKGIYCSQYVAMILVEGGARITLDDGRDPDRLFRALTGEKP